MRAFRVGLMFALGLVAAPLVAAVADVLVVAAPAGAATVALTVHDFAFLPPTLTVPVGTTVRVANTGSVDHTWSSDPGDAQTWNSGSLGPGATFSVTFNQAGTFGYHCNIHSFMTGTIVVTAATVSSTTVPQTTSSAGPAATAPRVTTPTSGEAGIAVPDPAVAATPTTLPHTGASNPGRLAAIAVTLTLFGLAFVASSHGRGRRRSRW